MNKYGLTKDIVFELILKFFKNDFKITSLAENARSCYYYCRKKGLTHTSFSMLGSMGQELSMGLGVSLALRKHESRKTVVITSDGSLLSNTNSFFTIGIMKPSSLIVICLDNEKHLATGGQETASKYVDLQKIAAICNFDSYRVENKTKLIQVFKQIGNKNRPIFIQVKVNDKKAKSENIREMPVIIFQNFSSYIQNKKNDKNQKI